MTADGAIPSDVFAGVPPQQKDSAPADVFAGVRPMASDSAPTDVFKGVAPEQVNAGYPTDVFVGMRPERQDSVRCPAPSAWLARAPGRISLSPCRYSGPHHTVFTSSNPYHSNPSPRPALTPNPPCLQAPTDVFAGTEPHHGPSDSLPSDVFAGVQPSAAQHGLANVVADKVNHLVEKVRRGGEGSGREGRGTKWEGGEEGKGQGGEEGEELGGEEGKEVGQEEGKEVEGRRGRSEGRGKRARKGEVRR